jgi:hypothetical protein
MASSKQFEWNDATVVILGKIITGITNIEVETKQDKEMLYGRGNKPLAIQSGKKSYEGSLTLLQSEYAALLLAAKAVNAAYDVTDIAFDITWQFNRELDSATETYNIVGVEITSSKIGMGSDDKNMEIELPFMALDLILLP